MERKLRAFNADTDICWTSRMMSELGADGTGGGGLEDVDAIYQGISRM